jgi:hypothetical protein
MHIEEIVQLIYLQLTSTTIILCTETNENQYGMYGTSNILICIVRKHYYMEVREQHFMVTK